MKHLWVLIAFICQTGLHATTLSFYLKKMVPHLSACKKSSHIVTALEKPLEEAVRRFTKTPGFESTLSLFLKGLHNGCSAKGYWYEIEYALYLAHQKNNVASFNPKLKNIAETSNYRRTFDLETSTGFYELKTGDFATTSPELPSQAKLILQLNEQRKMVMQYNKTESTNHTYAVVCHHEPSPAWQAFSREKDIPFIVHESKYIANLFPSTP